ncbi:MAG: hypothetical protein OXC41_00070 [Gammaproteobacteria bacterium]|nr:hypothetical protein [Gammaproteobacteria bacterium]
MKADMSLTYDAERASAINHEVEIRSLPGTSRKRIFKNLGRNLLKASRDHIRQQKTMTGEAMKKRKYGRGKVLKKMGKNIKFYASAKNVKLTWPNRMVAKLAYRHQFGVPEVLSASRMVNIHGTPDYQKPASRKQAKALIKSGFRVSTGETFKSGANKGRAKRRKPSQKWVTENMKMGQAALLIRKLKRIENPPKRWTVKIPARPFLGVTGANASEMMSNEIVSERKRRSKASR